MRGEGLERPDLPPQARVSRVCHPRGGRAGLEGCHTRRLRGLEGLAGFQNGGCLFALDFGPVQECLRYPEQASLTYKSIEHFERYGSSGANYGFREKGLGHKVA